MKIKEQRSITPHYFVKNGKYKPMFILWQDAFEYCEINNLNINCIYKSYKY